LYRDRGDWERAYEALDRSLKENPSYVATLATRATCYYQQRRWDEAAKDLDRAVELNPREVQVRTLRSRLGRERGEIDRAGADADEALWLAPEEADVLFEHAHIDRHRKDWLHLQSCSDRAAEHYRQGSERSKYSRSVAFRGLARGFLGRFESAFQDLEEAGREWPEDAVPHLYRGILLENQGKAEAIDAYRRAVQIDSSLGEPWSRLGKLLYGLGDHVAAAEALRQAVVANPGDHDAWSYLGLAYHALGNYPEAVLAFTHVLRCAQDWANRAAAYWMAGEALNAEGDARKAVDLDTNCVGAHEVLGRVAALQGEKQTAIAELSRVLELDGKRAAARALRGELFAKEGRTAEALKDLEQAVRDDPALRDAVQPLIDRLRGR